MGLTLGQGGGGCKTLESDLLHNKSRPSKFGAHSSLLLSWTPHRRGHS